MYNTQTHNKDVTYYLKYSVSITNLSGSSTTENEHLKNCVAMKNRTLKLDHSGHIESIPPTGLIR